jgi:eukaryotic-like serine/threonine-protein kinase
MPLSKGDRLGPYEILEAIGKGGMGEVFRARDTRLNRDVAIKVSSEHFSERFEREARVIASLNHPNICSLYDVGPNYLVMELVDGPTLAERITQGAISLDETAGIARQIAAALDAAHEKGVVHRDLKPGNVKIKPDGTVKVLDFGLAKIGGTPSVASDDSPTLTMGQTEAGMILGTAAYMPPEQAKGKPVDKRADIWAFGAMLYEMLTGHRLFQGETTTEVLAAVIREEPDLNRAPAQTQLLLRRCLEKDPIRRLRDIGDAMPLLETQQTGPPPQRAWQWPVLAGALLLIAVGLGSYFLLRENPRAPIETVRFQIPAPDKGSFNIYLTLSPDGRKLAYLANGADGQNRLWIRNIDSLESRPLAGTEGAASPFWSPDSRFIAFGEGSKVRRIDVMGGPVQTVADLPAPAGVGVWGADETILIGNRGAGPGMWRVSPTQGTASQITRVDTSRQERAHGFPVLLPDGRHFLYTRLAANAENAGVFLGSLDAKPDAQGFQRILPVQSSSMYVPPVGSGPGYLMFLQDRTLMAQPFDANRFELRGEPVALAEQIGTLGAYGFFSASAAGTLAYRLSGVDANKRQLAWYDRQGKALGLVGPPVDFGGQPVLSPDGGAVAIARIDRQAGFSDIWVHDLARNTDSRLTSGTGSNGNPAWSLDGSKIAFESNRGGTTNVYQKAANGVGQEEELDKDARSKSVRDWSRDGQYLIEEVGRSSETGIAVWVLPLFGNRKPFPYLESKFDEGNPKVSPNGQWLAYESNETKRNEIYVQSFPKPGGKWRVSTDGGTSPVWSRDGKELFFRDANGKLMAAEVRSGPGYKFDSDPAKPLFDLPGGAGTFDVTKDGRFLIPAPVGQSTSAPVTVVINWTAGLKRN